MRDVNAFRERYKHWKETGELPYKNGRPVTFDDGTEPHIKDIKKRNRPNIFRYDDGRYVYQAAPNTEEIDVTPINTLMPDASQWTYQDAEGKIYTPNVQVNTGTLTEAEDTNPLMRSANNYFSELSWRAQNDPSSIALQGKYTMPIVLSPLLAKAGEAAYAAGLTPYIEAGLTSAFAAHGLNHWMNEGINSGLDAAMTAMEIAPLGGLLKPTFEMGYRTAKPIFDRAVTSLQNNYPALFDPYTSWDATLGYHGDNIFSRAIGTIGRRHGYTPEAEVPEFHRRLLVNSPETFRMTEDGKFIMSSGRTGDGHDGIVNFATSEPARGHSNHRSLSGVNDFIIPSKVLKGVEFKSIQPSDTFFEVPELAVNPKQVTLVSGDPETLKYARSLGMRTLSSPRLRHFNSLNQEGISISGKIHKGETGRFNFDKGAEFENAEDIGKEMQRLTSMRGAPTLKDYAYFENATGLNSGVIPNTPYNLNNRIDLLGRYGNVRSTPIFNNVIYDPATNLEAIYRKAKIGKGTWDRYYEALEKLPSARAKTLGLREAAAPQITAENAANRAQEIQNLIPRYNKFAEYYGYNTVPEGVSTQEAENLIKEGLKQHNTFYRGLTYPEGEKLEAVKKVLGENASREEIMDYLAKSGSRDPNNTYFSLDERANQYARTGDVARYTRKYTLGDNPATWLEDADFAFDTTPATSFAPRGSVNYPWAGSYIKEAPGEVRINPEDVIFEGWMPKTTWEYGEYVKPSEYRANRNLYFNENMGGIKPTYSDGKDVSDWLLNFVADREGYRKDVYNDALANNIETIGYGFTDPAVINKYRRTGMSETVAKQILRSELNKRKIKLQQLVPHWNELTPNMQDSLTSYYYNFPFHNDPNSKAKRHYSPKLFKALENRDWQEAARQMDGGINQAKGLRNRRIAEQQHFLGNMSLKRPSETFMQPSLIQELEKQEKWQPNVEYPTQTQYRISQRVPQSISSWSSANSPAPFTRMPDLINIMDAYNKIVNEDSPLIMPILK